MNKEYPFILMYDYIYLDDKDIENLKKGNPITEKIDTFRGRIFVVIEYVKRKGDEEDG